jgi:hypothetical protein
MQRLACLFQHLDSCTLDHSYALLQHGLQKGVLGIGIKLNVDLRRHIIG